MPLAGVVTYLGLMLALGTTHPFQATVGRSMEPILHTGDLAVMTRLGANGVALGDVIAIEVSTADQERYGYPRHALHRVTDIRVTERGLVVQTKGDNQAAPDPFTTPVSEIHSRLKFHIPTVGYALFYLQSMQGKLALAGLLALFLLYEGIRWITDTAEELIEADDALPLSPPVAPPVGLEQFTGAIAEYGTHLRSHTRIVQALGDTTEELRVAASAQREAVSDLRNSVHLLAERVAGDADLGTATTPTLPPAPPASRPASEFAAPAPPPERHPDVAPRAPSHRDHVEPRPVLFADVATIDPGALVLRVQGFVDAHEPLRFGLALEAIADGAAVAFSASPAEGGAAFFTIATHDWIGTLTGMRSIREFSVHLISTDAA